MLRDFEMPAPLAARARAWVSGSTPAPARDAATVILVRDGGADGVEVFLQRRPTAMAFAAGMHVFPGGVVDPRDGEPVRWFGPHPEDLAASLSADPVLARAIVIAAVRETYEECGVLLAGRDGDRAVEDLSDPGWDTDRQALADGTASLAGLLGRRGLAVRADLLRPWAHWVTPAFEPRRYDTRFFLAAVPTGQQPRQVGAESDRSDWLPAAVAIDRAGTGGVVLMPPTLVCLEEVAAATSVAGLLGTSRQPRPVLPWLADGVLRVELDGTGGGAAR